MSNEPKLSAATRASSAYVQGRLAELTKQLTSWGLHSWATKLDNITEDWQKAEAELKAEASAYAAELERNIEREDQ